MAGIKGAGVFYSGEEVGEIHTEAEAAHVAAALRIVAFDFPPDGPEQPSYPDLHSRKGLLELAEFFQACGGFEVVE